MPFFYFIWLVPFEIDDLSKVTKVRFTPTEVGMHYLNAKYGSDIIPGKDEIDWRILIIDLK